MWKLYTDILLWEGHLCEDASNRKNSDDGLSKTLGNPEIKIQCMSCMDYLNLCVLWRLQEERRARKKERRGSEEVIKKIQSHDSVGERVMWQAVYMPETISEVSMGIKENFIFNSFK